MTDPMTGREPLDLPRTPARAHQALVARCLEACLVCARACTACADACLREPTVAELATCVRANLDCADVCDATARLLSRRSGQHTNLVRAFLGTCLMTCATCAEECAQHQGSYPYCRICAEACRICERVCQELLDAL